MDKDLELAIDNPQEFLSKPQPSREWDMSAEDIARSINYNPYTTLATKAMKEPEKYNWVESVLRGIGSSIESIGINTAQSTNDMLGMYYSPNMTQEQADRLTEDVVYAQNFAYKARQAEDVPYAKDHRISYDFAQGIGSFIDFALSEAINPIYSMYLMFASSRGQMQEQLADKYIEETGDIRGYAQKKKTEDILSTGFGVLNSAIERLGMEKLLGRIIRNPAKYGKLNFFNAARATLAREALKRTGKQFVSGFIREGAEEVAQSYLEDATQISAGYGTWSDLLSKESLRKALKSGWYGGIIGGAAGATMFNVSRMRIKQDIAKWSEEHKLNLTDLQVTQATDTLLNNGQEALLSEITTRAELKTRSGKAFEILVDKIKQQIAGTGTPFPADQDLDAYARTVAKTIQIPTQNLSLWTDIPIEWYLNAAEIRVTNGMWELAPIQSSEDVKTLIDTQKAVIKEQNALKKLGTEDANMLDRAKQRKNELQVIYDNLVAQEAIDNERIARKKEELGWTKEQDAIPAKESKYLENSADMVAFGDKIPEADRLNTMTDGKWNMPELRNRYKNAFMSWLTNNNQKAFDKLAFDTELPEKIIDPIIANGGAIVDLQTKYPEINIKEDIYRALQKYPRTNAENFTTVMQEAELNGRDVLPENVILWNFIFSDNTTIKMFFDNYVKIAMNNRDAVEAGENMVGEKVAPLSKKDLYAQALKQTDEMRSQISAENGKEYEPLFTETGEITDVNLQSAFISYQNQFNTPGRLFQKGFAAMRGELVGDALDADLFFGTGEKSSVWFWGNYLLADMNIDKENYLEKFEREGPALTYDGKPVTDKLLSEFGITSPEVVNKLKYSNSIFDTKERVIEDLERVYKMFKNDYDKLVNAVRQHYAKTISEDKFNKIVDDIEKIVSGKGATLGPAINFPEDSDEYKIQQKYKQNEQDWSDFVNVYVSLINQFEGKDYFQDPMDMNGYLNTLAYLHNFRKSLEKVNDLDWDKFAGQTGLSYQGKDIDIALSKLQALNDIPPFEANFVKKRVRNKIKEALVHGQNVSQAIKELETFETKELIKRLPAIKQEIKKGIERYKVHYPNADVKEVEKALLDFASGTNTADLNTFKELQEKHNWYGENAGLADIVYFSKTDVSIGRDIIDVVYDIREAKAELKMIKAAEKEFSNQQDFVYKPNASMYEFDVPASSKMLSAGTKLYKQSPFVQDALLKFIGDYSHLIPGLRPFVNVGIKYLGGLRDFFEVGKLDGQFDIALLKDMQNNMMKSPFYQASTWHIETALDRLMATSVEDAVIGKLGQKATIQDVIDAIDVNVESHKPGMITTQARDFEYEDMKTMGKILKDNLLRKYTPDTFLQDVASFIEEPTLSQDTGKGFYDILVRQLVHSPAVFDELKKDKSLGLREQPTPPEMASKLLRKYGIVGGRYYGKRDKRGFVTFDKTPMVKRLFQLAYTGSRADYDRPSLEAIGSGEGNQAHGWGLYYALNPAVAEGYKNRLTAYSNKLSFKGKSYTFGEDAEYVILQELKDGEKTIEQLKTEYSENVKNFKDYAEEARQAKDAYWTKSWQEQANSAEKVLNFINTINENDIETIKTVGGQVHEVDIPEMDFLLDEQKSFNKQSEFVQDNIIKVINELNKDKNPDVHMFYGTNDSAIKRIVGGWTGQQIYNGISEALGVKYANSDSDIYASKLLDKYGIKGITYDGRQDGRCFVIFNPESVKVLRKKFDELGNMLFQGKQANAWYDPELQIIALTKKWNNLSLVHELHHHYLSKLIDVYNQAKAGIIKISDSGMAEIRNLFDLLDIKDPMQLTEEQLTVAQERFAAMTEAYLTGLGVQETQNQAYKDFLNWIPEKYKSILNIGYLNEKNEIVNPLLDQDAIDFFNKWFGEPQMPALPTSPDAQSFVNPMDDKDEIIPSSQKEMNDREIKWGIDSAEQIEADKKLYNMIDEDTPNDLRAAIDGAKVELKNQPVEDTISMPEIQRKRWFMPGVKNAQERMAEMAKEYVAKNTDHAIELALADPEISTIYDAPIDRAWLIRAVMDITDKGSPEYAVMYDNLATYRSMSGSTLGLTNDISQQAYLEAKREIENSREMKAVINYAGNNRGAWDKWSGDIKAFINARVGKVLATEAGTPERKVALQAFIEEAKTKFSGNTEDIIFNQLDLTGVNARSKAVFVKWAEKAIKQATGVGLTNEQQKKLMDASVKAQQAMLAIDNPDSAMSASAARDLRKWQILKDELKKANLGRFDKFNNAMNNLFGGYVPSAMLMSFNTLFVANIPSTAINNAIIKSSAQKIFGEQLVKKSVLDAEEKRIREVYRATGMNLAQMERPTSPSLMHGEKYMGQEKSKWYDFTFKVLSWGDNLFRIPTFVDTLGRIASKNANGDAKLAEEKFRQYCQLNTTDEEAKLSRKQALAVSNMAVFTQDGILSSQLNRVRDAINKMSRGLLGLESEGFGLGNLLAPFLKTGANVVEMGVTGSIAPIRQIATWLKQLNGKEIPELQKIALRSDWKVFALTALSVALLSGLTGDDDDLYIEPYELGKAYDPERPYDSINIAGVWVKLDTFGVFSGPIRVAVKLIKDKNLFSAYGFGLQEAIGETPLLNNLTTDPTYMFKQPEKWAEGFGYTQANKFVPSQAKSLTRAGSRALGIEYPADWLGTYLQRRFHRNYGLDGTQPTMNDYINILTNRLKIIE